MHLCSKFFNEEKNSLIYFRVFLRTECNSHFYPSFLLEPQTVSLINIIL
jgi:hypothetical protein